MYMSDYSMLTMLWLNSLQWIQAYLWSWFVWSYLV